MNIIDLTSFWGRIKYKIKLKTMNESPKYIVSSSIKALTNKYGGHNMIDTGSTVKNCEIGAYSYISYNCHIQRAKIGKFCSIGPRVHAGFSSHPTKEWVTTHPAFYINLKSVIGYSFHVDNNPLYNPYQEVNSGYLSEIGNDVWIGADVKILDGVKIGDGAIIAAGAIITKDIEPYNIVGGIPAKFIRKRFTDLQISFLQKIKWWHMPIEWIVSNYTTFRDINTFIEKFNNLSSNEEVYKKTSNTFDKEYF